jgi:hypothetical protein
MEMNLLIWKFSSAGPDMYSACHCLMFGLIMLGKEGSNSIRRIEASERNIHHYWDSMNIELHSLEGDEELSISGYNGVTDL